MTAVILVYLGFLCLAQVFEGAVADFNLLYSLQLYNITKKYGIIIRQVYTELKGS